MKNKYITEAEKKIISFILYYDDETLKDFVESFIPTVESSDFKIGEELRIIILAMEHVLNYSPELLNKDYNTFDLNALVHELKNIIKSEEPSKKMQERVFKFLDEAVLLSDRNISKNEEFVDMFLLGKECVDYYFWTLFREKVDQIDSSRLSYREKLNIKLPEIHENSQKIFKLSEIKSNDYFENSPFTTGISELDEYINIMGTNVMYVAARPSVGKSMEVVNMGLKNAILGKTVLYISLEMNNIQTKGRTLTWLNKGEVEDPETAARLEESEEFKLIDENFYILEADSLNGDILTNYIEQFLKEYGDPENPAIIILDSVNLVRYSGLDEWASLRRISREFKKIGLKYKSVMVACVQASRDSETSGLTLASLFGSSTLEQDADIVIGMEPKNHTPGKVSDLNVTILKNRDGIRDLVCNIKLDKSCMRFYDKNGSN